MQNLRDQLLKAGLINEADAKKAEADKARERARASARREPAREGAQRGGHGGGGERRPARSGSRGPTPIPKLPPLAVPNNKEYQRQEARRQLELDRQIRELVLANQVAPESTEHTFHFVTRKNRLRRMEMSPAQAQQLERGELAVVERPDPGQIEHALVPAAIAERLLTMHPKSVRFFNRAGAPVGFLTDEELARRQKAEADREAREAATAVSETDEGAGNSEASRDENRRVPTATSPDDADDHEPGEREPEPESEGVAAQAERIAAAVPDEVALHEE